MTEEFETRYSAGGQSPYRLMAISNSEEAARELAAIAIECGFLAYVIRRAK